MKTFYWSFVLMLLPSMAYTQTTEKENEFSMSMQIRPRAEYRNGAIVPRNEGQKAASFINNRARLSLDYKRSDPVSYTHLLPLRTKPLSISVSTGLMISPERKRRTSITTIL